LVHRDSGLLGRNRTKVSQRIAVAGDSGYLETQAIWSRSSSSCGGPWARGSGSWAGSFRLRRMARAVANSVMKEMILMLAPQKGHNRGSISPDRKSLFEFPEFPALSLRIGYLAALPLNNRAGSTEDLPPVGAGGDDCGVEPWGMSVFRAQSSRGHAVDRGRGRLRLSGRGVRAHAVVRGPEARALGPAASGSVGSPEPWRSR